jgi:hypothetical protein
VPIRKLPVPAAYNEVVLALLYSPLYDLIFQKVIRAAAVILAQRAAEEGINIFIRDKHKLG